eukprot:3837369-Pyramimonas_sp.AAC.2
MSRADKRLRALVYEQHRLGGSLLARAARAPAGAPVGPPQDSPAQGLVWLREYLPRAVVDLRGPRQRGLGQRFRLRRGP